MASKTQVTANTDTRKRKMYVEVENRINEAFYGIGVDDLNRIQIVRGEGRYNRVTFNLLIDGQVAAEEVTIEELGFVARGMNVMREALVYLERVPENKLFRRRGLEQATAATQPQPEAPVEEENNEPKVRGGVARISRRRNDDPKVASSSKRSVKARVVSRGARKTEAKGNVPQIRSNPEARTPENRQVARRGGMEIRRDARTPAGVAQGGKSFLQRTEGGNDAPQLPSFLKRSS